MVPKQYCNDQNLWHPMKMDSQCLQRRSHHPLAHSPSYRHALNHLGRLTRSGSLQATARQRVGDANVNDSIDGLPIETTPRNHRRCDPERFRQAWRSKQTQHLSSAKSKRSFGRRFAKACSPWRKLRLEWQSAMQQSSQHQGVVCTEKRLQRHAVSHTHAHTQAFSVRTCQILKPRCAENGERRAQKKQTRTSSTKQNAQVVI